jgi:hypothetical protein
MPVHQTVIELKAEVLPRRARLHDQCLSYLAGTRHSAQTDSRPYLRFPVTDPPFLHLFVWLGKNRGLREAK